MTYRHMIIAAVLSGAVTTGAGNNALAATGLDLWSYQGQFGPEHWSELGDAYALCSDGERQSPVDVSAVTITGLPPVEFHYRDAPLDIIDNGHAIEVAYAEGSHIKVGDRRYELLQFHFHSPGEHTIGGKQYPMAVHLVHRADDGQLGVVGVMMKEGAANDLIDQLLTLMPTRKGTRKTVEAVQINAAALLPRDTTYFNYSGSLTTPPCSEGVNWMLMVQPIEVSGRQIERFRARYSGNNRPIQPLNGRQVRLSN